MSFLRRQQLSTFYFFLMGLSANIIPMVVIWIAVDDILAGTLWSTTVLLIAFSIPDILAKVVSPVIINRITFHLSFALLTILMLASILLLVLIDDVRVRIAGVTVLGLANGFAVITIVTTLSYFETAALLANAYQNGRQCSLFLASLGYTGLTTWFCVAPRITIAVCIPICFIPLGIYILLDKEPLKDHLQGTAKLVQYTKLPQEEYSNDKHDTTADKLISKTFLLLVKSFPLFIYGYFSSFCIHFSMTAVLTTLTFPSSPFLPRDHFQYYRMISDAGIVIGGLGSFILGCTGQKWMNKFFGIRNTGLLVVINVIHMLFFVVASWHRFLPNVIPVFVLCFTQGIAFGIAAVQSLICATNLFSSPNDKATALRLQEVGVSVGRVGAAFLGVFTEKYLREHCTYNLLLGEYCLARIPSSAGWSTNLICNK
ncbi:uncharacterized protein LOC116308325 [Actinia tenebrosa]|uniref:Battenin n=1 Tax=Actinia tenebrosa TaxID=6105 RepID=A0A6P8JA10_ACTTE|nr:uncharacterized protein LOC116308325 [Actinia tenebrosa]